MSLGSLIASTERLGHTYLKQIQEVRPTKDGVSLVVRVYSAVVAAAIPVVRVCTAVGAAILAVTGYVLLWLRAPWPKVDGAPLLAAKPNACPHALRCPCTAHFPHNVPSPTHPSTTHLPTVPLAHRPKCGAGPPTI